MQKEKIIISFTFFWSILVLSAVFLSYSTVIKRFIFLVYGLWLVALGDILNQNKFYVYGGFFLVLSVIEAPFLIVSQILGEKLIVYTLLQTNLPPAGSVFLQPGVLTMIILISAFGMMMWIIYGEKRGRAFKFASMTMIMTPPLIVFIETMTMPTDQLKYYVGDLANIIESINFPPLEFLIRGIIALMFFIVFIIIAIAISVLASVLKSFMAD